MKIIVGQNIENPSVLAGDKGNSIGFGDFSLTVLPETAIVRKGVPFFVPDWGSGWIFNVYAALVITRLGKAIPAKFSNRYYENLHIGFKVSCKSGCCVDGFDGSVLISENIDNGARLNISEQELPHAGNSPQILYKSQIEFKIDETVCDSWIETVSRFFTLHTGDILMFPFSTSETVPVVSGCRLTVTEDDRELMTHKIK